MTTQTTTTPAGFIANGSGPDGERYGRDPVTGRAFKRDGTVRAERVTLSPAEKVAKAQAEMQTGLIRLGAEAMTNAGGAAASLAGTIGSIEKRAKRAVRLANPEWVEAERVRLTKALDTLDDRHADAIDAAPALVEAADSARDALLAVGNAVASGKPFDVQALAAEAWAKVEAQGADDADDDADDTDSDD